MYVYEVAKKTLNPLNGFMLHMLLMGAFSLNSKQAGFVYKKKYGGSECPANSLTCSLITCCFFLVVMKT